MLSFLALMAVVGSATAVTDAFYILFANDIENPTFPKGFEEYKNGIFVTSPQNITRAHTERVRAAIPGSRVLAYWDYNHIPIRSGCSTGHVMGDKPGRNCSTSYSCGSGNYTSTVNRVFPSKYAINRLSAHAPLAVICLYPGLAGYAPFPANIDIMVDLLVDVVQTSSFDGIYLDGTLNANVYASVVTPALSGVVFDCNGDGKPDTVAELIQQYVSWSPVFMRSLRARLGEAILVGNSGGPLSDPSLNGITIEMEACLDLQACEDALRGQYSVSAQPPVSVLWLTHSETLPPAEQCQRATAIATEMPWVQVGTDFFDGSHIVCNTTRN